MDPATLQKWLTLFAAAESIGEAVYDAVKNHATGTLSQADYLVLEQAWNDDVVRSAANAGIAAVPDVPLPGPISAS